MRNIQTVYQNKSSNEFMSFWLLDTIISDILAWQDWILSFIWCRNNQKKRSCPFGTASFVVVVILM